MWPFPSSVDLLHLCMFIFFSLVRPFPLILQLLFPAQRAGVVGIWHWLRPAYFTIPPASPLPWWGWRSGPGSPCAPPQVHWGGAGFPSPAFPAGPSCSACLCAVHVPPSATAGRSTRECARFAIWARPLPSSPNGACSALSKRRTRPNQLAYKTGNVHLNGRLSPPSMWPWGLLPLIAWSRRG